MSTPPTPDPEAMNVAPSTRAYLGTLESLGMLEGDSGDQVLRSDALEVLIALHHVLAGGTVIVEIQSEGTPSMVEDLNTMLGRAVEETNQLALREPGTKF
jgi:hypothetical protein